MDRTTRIRSVRLEGDSERIKLSPTTEQVATSHVAKQRLIVIRELKTIAQEFGYALPEGTVMISIANMIIKHFGDLQIQDIQDAFDLSAAGRLNVDTRSFGKGLNKDIVGRVLNQHAQSVRPYRKHRRKEGEPMSSPEKMSDITREQLSRKNVSTMVDRIIHCREKLEQGKNVIIGAYQFDFLRKCGIKWTKEQMDKALTQATETVKSEIQKKRMDREINGNEFDNIMRAIEARSNRGQSLVQLEAKKILARKWILSSTQDAKTMFEEFIDNYQLEPAQ